MSAGFRIAYLVFAHHKPYQLERLLKRLDDGQSGFFLHIDRRSPIAEFKEALAAVSAGPLTLVKRIPTRWGAARDVECSLNAMAAVFDSPARYDYVVFLSGQDYPIKSNREIVSFLEQNRERSFVRHEPIPGRYEERGGMYRIDTYHFHLLGRRLSYPDPTPTRTLKGRLLYSLLGLRFGKPRLFPSYLHPYLGDANLFLSRKATRYILDFAREHPDYLRFLRYTFAPAEVFSQTILANAPEDVRENIVDVCLGYRRYMGAHPVILTTQDLPVLRSANKLFARKFDMEVDSGVLDALDASTREEY
jgi:hypothetical protein